MSAETAESHVMSLIYTTLSSDTTLMAIIQGIYDDVAPYGSSFPHVVLIVQSDETITAIAPRNVSRVYDNIVVLVKVVDQQDSYETVRTAMNRIDVLLSAAYNSYVKGFIREDLIKFVENSAADTPPFRHLGYMYHTIATNS